MKYRIVNLAGTKQEPKRFRKSSVTSTPVRIGRRFIPPAKHAFMSLDQMLKFETQVKFFLDNNMIRIDCITPEAEKELMDALYPKSEAAPEPDPEPVKEKPAEPVVEKAAEAKEASKSKAPAKKKIAKKKKKAAKKDK